MSCIDFDATMENVATAMLFLRKKSLVLPGGGKKVEMAVEEMLLNIVRYAYVDGGKNGSGKGDGPVRLGVRMAGERGRSFFVVWLKDWGVPFDPFTDAPKPDTTSSLSERPIGGLGIHLVKSVCSKYTYSRSRGANMTELYFLVEDESR